jgi:signal peptidase II
MKIQLKSISLILLYVIIDQFIKLIILEKFMDTQSNILGEYIMFCPVINPKLSYGAHFIPFLNNPIYNYIVIILSILIYMTGYSYYCRQYKNEKTELIAKLIYTIGTAGILCSLIDKLFWKGSLDYIKIESLFTFDLKDFYLSSSIVLFLFCYYKYKIALKEYFIYMRSLLFRSK